jgi:hypothetical protein
VKYVYQEVQQKRYEGDENGNDLTVVTNSIRTWFNHLNDRDMTHAVSRRSLTAGSQVRSPVSPCGICGGQSGTRTGFSPSTSVFPCQYHSTVAPLLVKMKKTAHLSLHRHHRVAQ